MSSISTLPSTLIYSLDVPEIKNFESKFFYNFFVVDELLNDTGKISKEVAELANISSTIFKKLENQTLEDIDKQKVPRYVFLNFTVPYKSGFSFENIPDSINVLDSIIYEENFASDYYTSVNINNQNIERQTTNTVEKVKKLSDNSITFSNIIETLGENFDDQQSSNEYASNVAASMLMNNGLSFNQALIQNNKFSNLKKVRFDAQLNNNVVYDFFIYASGSALSNNEFYSKNLDFAKNKVSKNPKFAISDSEFKPTIKTYQDGVETDSTFDPKCFEKYFVGYLIEKIELLTDGSIKKFNPIIIKSPYTSSYIDFKVRYGAIYVYKIRGLFKIKYPSIETDSLDFKLVTSYIASKPTLTYVETTEMVAPPPPSELGFVWDYDRINLNTAEFLPGTNEPLHNVGVRGSLMIHWSYPVNSQMDIKYFQVFRRKTIDEPFELIKMFDFNDSISKIPLFETNISNDLIEISTFERLNKPALSIPVLRYYDDDFYKNSEYIYACAAVDAHGLTSNYSSQFQVKFDVFSNSLVISLVSIPGAPKQYPNLYLNRDLFLDTIKNSYKKIMKIYFSPDCYSVTLGGANNKTQIINFSSSGTKYAFNFINTDKAIGKNVFITLNDILNVN